MPEALPRRAIRPCINWRCMQSTACHSTSWQSGMDAKLKAPHATVHYTQFTATAWVALDDAQLPVAVMLHS